MLRFPRRHRPQRWLGRARSSFSTICFAMHHYVGRNCAARIAACRPVMYRFQRPPIGAQLAASEGGAIMSMNVQRAVLGRNVEMVNGPRPKGRRIGTLKMGPVGLEFSPKFPTGVLLPFHWTLPWERVAKIDLGGDVAQQWMLLAPLKKNVAALHLTVTETSGQLQGFLLPHKSVERVHNQLLPVIQQLSARSL